MLINFPFPSLIACLLTAHFLSGFILLLSRRLYGPFVISFFHLCFYTLFVSVMNQRVAPDLLSLAGLPLLLSVIIFVFYSKNQLLYLVFRLGAATSLLVLLGFYLIPDATRYLSAIFVTANTLYAYVVVRCLIELSSKDQKALILLAETQSLLADRKQVLEETNKKIASGNQELERTNKKISLILDTANDAFVSMDGQGVTLEWNKKAESLFGISRDDAVGNKLNVILIPDTYQQEIENEMSSYSQVSQKYVIDKLIEIKAFRNDGVEFPAEMSLSIFRYEGNYTFNAFIRDISNRKRAEQEIKGKAAELARSNAELEQFAYVASHDLQEPLRMVASYTQLLEKKYSDKLDPQAREFIKYAVDGVMRMQQLIRDLLEYSRVGTRLKELVPVDLQIVLKKVTDNLKIAIEESGTKIIADQLPSVLADETQMIQLIQNLIGNAIKFRKKDLNPIIELKSEKKDHEWIIKIQDNGIGIDTRYKDKIFVIFQRLHTQKQYPGTGIGLAVCKKIVERHGGRIWIESGPEMGTTFFFSLQAV
ncbi:MAG: hypothetical protein ACD_73C00088G0001, partial [uncultured bacterium]